jgi:hypothetical protein
MKFVEEGGRRGRGDALTRVEIRCLRHLMVDALN